MKPTESPSVNRTLTWIGVLFAIVFPTIVTWAYFFQADAAGQGVQRAVMASLKVLQFAFPLVWTWLVLRERIGPWKLTMRGVPTGILFGLVVTAASWALFHFVLAASPPFIAATDAIREKVAGFGIDSFTKYAALGLFYALFHSLLEEYYWRWFVFGQMRRLVPVWPAIIVSSIGFMAHHVLVLSKYFGWWTAPTLLLSAAVAIGGAFWAWLYNRSGSLLGPWISHLIIDAGIFLVGYQLIQNMLS